MQPQQVLLSALYAGCPRGRVYLAQSLQWLHDLELTLLTVVQDAARSLEADNDGRWLAYRGLCNRASVRHGCPNASEHMST